MAFIDSKRYSGRERREHDRVPKTFLVVCKDAAGTITTIPHFVYAYGKNISKGGIFFESVEKFPLHARLEFSLYASALPEAIKVTGDVVWVRPAEKKDLFYYGVKFCEVSKHDILLIEQLVGAHVNISSAGSEE